MAPAAPEAGVGLKRTSVGPSDVRLEHLPDLATNKRHRRYGSVVLEPLAGTSLDEIVAGKPLGLLFVYSAGGTGLSTGAQLGLAWRLPGDWGEPQFERHAAANYVTANASDGVELELAFDHRGGVAPWGHLLSATLKGDLPAGGTVTLVCGDRSGGGPGWEAQTSSLPDHRFLFMVRPAADESWLRLTDPPPLKIRGGPAVELALVCPSDCLPGEPFTLTVRGVDLWGNPSRGHAGDLELSAPGLELLSLERLSWDGEEHDLWRATARFEQPGLQQIRARTTAGLEAEGNPLCCHRQPPSRSLYWGDLHGGQGDLGVGQGTLDRYFDYARQVAGLQFTSHQANDVYVTQADWRHTRTVTEAHHRPGEFAAFLGCEWSAFKHNGGDHNVFYRHDQPSLQRAQRWFVDPNDDWPEAPTPPDLYRSLEGVEAMINLHVGGFTSDLDHHDPRLEKLIEIHCTHATSRWFVIDGLARGHQFGIVGSSDAISGRTGADRPGRRQSRNLRNGLTGVYATELTREALWEAFQARRCFGTSGERIALWVEADGHAMGEAFTAHAPPEIRVTVAGTAAIERILLRRGAEVVAERRISGPDRHHPGRYRLLWRGSRERGTSRDQKLSWDGSLTLSEGRLEPVATVDFYRPIDLLEQPSAGTLAWRCDTAGNEAGLVFDVEAPAGASFAFITPPCSFRCSRDEVEAGFQRDLPELLDGGVRFERALDPAGPREVEIGLRDPGTPSGVHPYWIEVVQIDGARAWSSPLYIELGRARKTGWGDYEP